MGAKQIGENPESPVGLFLALLLLFRKRFAALLVIATPSECRVSWLANNIVLSLSPCPPLHPTFDSQSLTRHCVCVCVCVLTPNIETGVEWIWRKNW